MSASIARICRYPVKGLSADELDSVPLEAGHALPHDRRFAVARASTPIDTTDPEWLPKHKFHMLARDEKLAQLAAEYDPETTKLVLHRKGRPVARGRLNDPMGRTLLGQFFAAFLGEDAKGTPKLVDAGQRTMADQGGPVVSVINLASVRDLQRVTGRPVDPIRFRGNLYLEGLEPWAERRWPGGELAVGGARLRVLEEIGRCAATEVNPDTATRDLNLVSHLQRGYGHTCMGVYCEVVEGAEVRVGDRVEPQA